MNQDPNEPWGTEPSGDAQSQRAAEVPATERLGRPAGGPERPPEESAKGFRGTGIYASLIVGFLVAAALLIFVAQNTESVHLEWLAWSIGVPVAALLLGSVLVGSLLTVIGGLFWRRRRRRVLTEREELRHLRSSTRPPVQAGGPEGGPKEH